MKVLNDKVLTGPETQSLINLFKKIQPGYLPFEIFAQLARVVATPIIEIMPFRQNHKTEILLTRRASDDNFWPGLWHVPGTIVRGSDVDLNEAFDRVLIKELRGVKTTKPVLVQSALRKSERGRESAQIFWVEVEDEPDVGQFFDVEALPDDIIQIQLEFIKTAAEAYKS